MKNGDGWKAVVPNEKRFFVLIILAALLAIAGCGGAKTGIVGKWKSHGSSGEVVWEFFDNGQLSAGGQPGRYTFGDGGRIKIQTQTATFVNQLELQGDRMTWKTPDGSRQEFTRVK
jgi:hypothetical protein